MTLSQRQISPRIEERKTLTSAPGLLVGLCRQQILAKYFRGPVRYRLRHLGQLTAYELRYRAVATAMRGAVVHD